MSSSRPYKVGLPAPIKGTVVTAEDHVTSTLDLPPVLPPEAMSGLLQAALGMRHFVPNEGGKMERERDGVKVEVDPSTGSLTVSVTAEEDVSPPPSNPSPCGCRYAEAVKAATASVTAVQGRLQEFVTGQLAESLGKVGCEMEGISWSVLVEALKIKAVQLGEVKAVDEDKKGGTMTILVEV